jgi:uncharacterized membrane protein YeaQ/YmgE (transglycosylase-associated protein family)
LKRLIVCSTASRQAAWRPSFTEELRVHLSDERAIVILLVGATAGLLMSKLVRGTGLGMIGDGAVGIVGAFVSDWLLLRFHFHFGGGVIGLIVRAAIGAIVVVLVLRVSGASRWGAGR